MSEALIILLLILINGVFSMAEIALVSSNRIRLQHEAEEDNKESQRALELANSPGKFLSTVQIAITSIGILSGVFGGAIISRYFKDLLDYFEILKPYNESLSYIITFLLITYASLVLGELIPKRLALLYPETISKKLSGFMKFLTIIGGPLVWILNRTTEGILYLFGIKNENQREISVSEEDITAMIERGTETGTFEEVEQDIVERLFFLSDRNVGSIMTSKTDIITLDINDEADIVKSIIEQPFINFPVYENEIDNIIGVLNSRKVLSKVLAGEKINYRNLLTPPFFVHDKLEALKLLERFKKAKTELAIVVDEFGSFSGIITLKDLFEALVGEVSGNEEHHTEITARGNNSWLVDGLISFDEFLRYFDIEDENIHKENDFYTLSGFVMYITRRIPKTGEKFEWQGLTFEVVDMDGLRVDKVLVERIQNYSSDIETE